MVGGICGGVPQFLNFIFQIAICMKYKYQPTENWESDKQVRSLMRNKIVSVCVCVCEHVVQGMPEAGSGDRG